MVVMVLAGNLSLIEKFQAEVDARYSKDESVYHKTFPDLGQIVRITFFKLEVVE